MTAIAEGSQHSVSMIVEVTYGTTPSTPAMTSLPHTAFTLGLQKDAIQSSKLRADRQIEDVRHGNVQIGGDLTAELEYGAFDAVLEAVFMGTWSGDVLKVGSTRRSFTIERKFANIATPEWWRYTGCEFNTMNLSVAPNSMIGATFGVVGQGLSIGTAIISGQTYGADVGNIPFDSFTGAITEGGSAIAIVTAADISLDNGLEPRFVIGSNETIQPTAKRSNCSGSITAFFESKTLFEKFQNETASELVLTLTDPAGADYAIDIPNIKYMGGNPDVSDEGSVSITMDFQALYSSGDASQIVITRTAA